MSLITNINLDVRNSINVQTERATDGVIVTGPDPEGRRLKKLFKFSETDWDKNAKAQHDEFVSNANAIMQEHFKNYEAHLKESTSTADQKWADFLNQLEIENA